MSTGLPYFSFLTISGEKYPNVPAILWDPGSSSETCRDSSKFASLISDFGSLFSSSKFSGLISLLKMHQKKFEVVKLKSVNEYILIIG